MKTISSILAIAAIMTTTDAMFTNIDEDFLNSLRFSYVDPIIPREPAYTINSEVNFRFFFRGDRSVNGVSLTGEDLPQILPDPRRIHPTCGSSLAVHIQTLNQFFCKIISFKFDVVNDASNQPRYLRFMLYLKKDGFLPLVLGVPVLKLPATAPQTENELDNWGNHYGVGTKPPFDIEKLLTTEATKSMTINFPWLQDLVTFGLTKKQNPSILQVEGQEVIATTYVTRPLLLSEELMVGIKHFIDTLKDPTVESEGSNTIPLNDDSEEEFTSGL